MLKNIYKKVAFAVIPLILLAVQINVVSAQGTILVNTDYIQQDNTYIFDGDDTGGDITLQFGGVLEEYLEWNDTGSSFRFSDDLDLENNQLLNTRIENLALAPTCDGTVNGKVYYNTTDTYSYVCNGTSWMQIDGGGGGVSKLFQGIDSVGLMKITNVAQPIPLDYVSIKDDYYSHSAIVNPAEVTILNEGWYKVDAMITVATVSTVDGIRGNPVMHIEIDSGSGFVQQPDATGGYIRENADGLLSTSLTGVGFFYFSANDVIRITILDTIPIQPDEETVAFSSRLVLAYIDRTGSASGSVDNLKDIGDVDASAPSDGQVLTFDSVDSKWKAENAVVVHTQNTDTGSISNTFILDQDDTGGDVTLQFGTTLNEYIEWNDSAQAFLMTDDLYLNNNELKEFKIENLALAPTCDSTLKGKVYHNTTDTYSYVCNGTAWVQIDAVVETSVFGTEYDYIEDETLSTTTSTSYVQKLRLTTASLPAGNYRIGYSYQWALLADDRDFMAEVQVDSTTVIHDHHQEPKEKGAGQEFANSGFKVMALGDGVHTIDIVYATEDSAKLASIWGVRLEIWRVE